MAEHRLSDKQREILEYIKEEILAKGYPPAVREICTAVHLKSTSSVHAQLATLEKNGYIRRDPTKPRAIEIIDEEFQPSHREMANVPVLGKVAAGQPLLALNEVTDYFPVPVQSLPNAQTFIVTVKGDSMIDMGIFDGDQLLVESQTTASNGDVVIALVEDSATVKRFYKEDGHYRLQPENSTMDPIIVQDCQVLGKVIGLFRWNIQ